MLILYDTAIRQKITKVLRSTKKKLESLVQKRKRKGIMS